jgi:hypothetical protein
VDDGAGCVDFGGGAAREDDVATEELDGRRSTGCELRAGLENVGVGDGLLAGGVDPAELHPVSASKAQPKPAATWRSPRPIRPR